ncbi:hypothetical protein HELRODRAFT_103603 [Helobdella robusta]|uniref:Cleavage/polyadenylation specificity factor A subunit C-terminal domain-containing protein n=1 Tax=Helobdella robusta TaxID=6412 RepID=T1EDG6_HELRO|nr:hypothetical protein HELRODRAFT_103603 [Helobdella robusta]ESN93223.1 hypothetical protein HELRODRAFT_103603 [Helobdella robusta]
MYSVHRQLHHSTVIKCAVECHFFNKHENNLVLAGIDELYVFRARKCDLGDSGVNTTVKLECLASYKLFGNILSLHCLKSENSCNDSLLIAFKEAKLSLVSYSEVENDLKTISLHCFESLLTQEGRQKHNYFVPLVRVDELNRCAVLLVHDTLLAVVPLRNANMLHDSASSYTIDLKKLDERVINVKDIDFLHGYYEPTLAILFEPLPTWAGRVAVRKDTCHMVALSINMEQRVSPIIWSVNNLPFDSSQLIPVQKPIGGVLVVAYNSLMYLNQSFPPFGVSLNSMTHFSTDFILKKQNINITLDCSRFCLLSADKFIISLKGGELFILSLLADGMNSVKGFHFNKAASSVLTSCICLYGGHYVFLGSRLGNSLLLKYSERLDDQVETGNHDSEVDKDFHDCPFLFFSSFLLPVIETLEMDMYGGDKTSTNKTFHYFFEVCDSLVNIGPCGHIVMGEVAFLSEEFYNAKEPNVELVTTSGCNKNGAITVLQKSIHPQLVTTFELPGCVNMWTAIGQRKNVDNEEFVNDLSHSILVISRRDSSMILKTGHEIMEIDNSDFITQTPTIYVGNMGNNQYIVQVSPTSVRLLCGVTSIQEIILEEDVSIVSCSVADPHLSLLSSQGMIIYFTLVTNDSSPAHFVRNTPTCLESYPATAICLFEDKSGLFNIDNIEISQKNDSEMKNFTKPNKMYVDEDELLYGEATNEQDNDVQMNDDLPHANLEHSSSSFWLFVCRKNGFLEILSVPSFKPHFGTSSLIVGERHIVDDLERGPTVDNDQLSGLVIDELLVVGMGYKQLRPHIMVIINQELMIYEVFKSAKIVNGCLNIRFKKVDHRPVVNFYNKINCEGAYKVTYLKKFENVSGLDGVFLSGQRPYWIFMTCRGILRMHPMYIDGPIICFTSFHNVNCPQGFLYFNFKNELRIAMLPSHLNYDSCWPFRKIPLRSTPYYLCYHLESKLYVVITSQSVPCQKLIRIVGDNEKEIETVEKDARFVYPNIEQFSLKLFSPLSWEMIPQCSHQFEEFERVTCMQLISFKSEGTACGLKGYIVCGTSYAFTEDIPCKGKIYIFDVIEVVPEPGAPLTKNKLKIEYQKEQKGGVSAIAGVQGLLATAIGQKIYIWQFKDGDLKGVAFIDTQMYAHSIIVIKSLLLVGDICKSVSLLRFQEEMKVLSLVSKDTNLREIYCLGFLVSNEQLNFIVSDSYKNLSVFSYMPQMKDSHGGQRLIQQADINIGSLVNSMVRIRCTKRKPNTENLHSTYYCTLDGGIGCILPLGEKIYRRLLMLNYFLSSCIHHYAGLDPRVYTSMKQDYRCLATSHKVILDEHLLLTFFSLTFQERHELAKKIGSSVEQIMADLVEFDHLTSHF